MSIKTKPSSVDMKKINNNNLNEDEPFDDVIANYEMKDDEKLPTATLLNENHDATLTSYSLWKQIITSVVFSIFLVSLGGSQGYTGIILPAITNPNSDDIYLNTQQISLFTSFLSIGHLMGSLVCGFLLLHFGQRRISLMIIPITTIGWLISYFAYSFWLLCLSRIILGLMFSLILNCSATYIAEIACPSIRGRLISLTSICLQIGVLLVYVVGSTDLHWRSVGLVCGLSPLIPCVFLFLAPDSPRWLALKGYPDERIMSSLRYFRGRKYPVEGEMREIKASINGIKRPSIMEQLRVVKNKTILKRLCLLIYLYIAANFTGYFSLSLYSVSIFKSATNVINPYLSTILCGTVKVIGTLLYSVTIDRLGRRPMFLTFLSLSSIWTIVIGAFFYLKHIDYDTSSFDWLPLVCLLLDILFSSLYQPIVILLRTELLPNSVRSLGVGIASLSYSLAAFLVAYAHPILVENIGSHWTFWLYSLDAVIMIGVIYFFLPETKGKSLEEIENESK